MRSFMQMGRVFDANVHERRFDVLVARMASRQYGVVAREQLLELGATKGVIQRRLLSGRWEQMARGVFRVAGNPPSWAQSLVVACLAWGPGTRVSHCAAAPLWGFAGFSPGAVELTVPPGRRRRAPGTVYRNVLAPNEVSMIRNIPVTTPARTLLDVASVASSETLEESLDDALRRQLVSIGGLRRHLRRWEGSRLGGTSALRKLVGARDGTTAPPQSVFETRMLRLMRRARLPKPVCQYPVLIEGRVVALLDFAFPELRLAVETDGYRWHSGRVRFERDRTRQNELTLLGWRIIHVTWKEFVSAPDKVIGSITQALRITTRRSR